jgi:hypothetical protein
VFGGQEMLGEIVPLRVEKDLVEDHISQDDDWSLLGSAPPRFEGVETFLVLILKVLIDILPITNLYGTLQLFIINSLKLILKANFILSSLRTKNCEEYGSFEAIDSSIVGNYNLVDGGCPSGYQIMNHSVWIWVGKTHEKVSIAL